jgi:hypothetical protein
MEWWKILSLVIAALYIVGAVLSISDDTTQQDIFETVAGIIFWLLFSIGCIWYGNEVGEGFVGAKFGLISKASPGCIIAFMGWVLLLLPIWAPLLFMLIGFEI